MQIIVVLNVAQGQNLTSRCLAPAFPGCPPLAGLARPGGEHGWHGLNCDGGSNDDVIPDDAIIDGDDEHSPLEKHSMAIA